MYILIGGEYQDKSSYFSIFGIPLVILSVFCHAVLRRESIAFNHEPCPRIKETFIAGMTWVYIAKEKDATLFIVYSF